MVGRRVAARVAGALVLGSVLATSFALPLAPRAAAAADWSWTLSPTTLTEGVPTDITATVTDGGASIGSMSIKIPAGFAFGTAWIVSMPTGVSWTVSAPPPGSTVTRVTFAGRTPADLFVSGQAVFRFRVTAASSPLPSWTPTAYTSIDGSGNAGSATQPNPFVIVGPPTPTPAHTPAPTLAPTPTPTPGHTLASTPTPSSPPTPASTKATAPVSTPGANASSAAQPTTAVVSASPTASSSPSGGPGPSDTPTAEPTRTEPTASPDQAPGLDVLPLPPGANVSIEMSGTRDMAMYAWAVPVLFMGLPGLLLVLVVLIQAGFAWFFVPVTTRVLGFDNRRKKRRKSANDPRNA